MRRSFICGYKDLWATSCFASTCLCSSTDVGDMYSMRGERRLQCRYVAMKNGEGVTHRPYKTTEVYEEEGGRRKIRGNHRVRLGIRTTSMDGLAAWTTWQRRTSSVNGQELERTRIAYDSCHNAIDNATYYRCRCYHPCSSLAPRLLPMHFNDVRSRQMQLWKRQRSTQ